VDDGGLEGRRAVGVEFARLEVIAERLLGEALAAAASIEETSGSKSQDND
jgi:hypothetical protein